MNRPFSPSIPVVSAAAALALSWVLWSGTAVARAAQATPSFNRDVRPILADKCFSCHGFDAGQRQAGLRLDTADGAYGAGDSGKVAIRAGAAAASELWVRINSDDPDERMPPASSHKTLTDTERAVIRQWIDAGAAYQGHWAFEPIQLPSPANTRRENSIDAWIEDRLQSAGFALAPTADRATLLRRLSFDLIGLPPTPAEIAAFLQDSSPSAYEKQVDRLLASPHFGERLAVMWLDVARYGDTNGYLHDILRTGWPWRDWVIQSFQHDKPFDQFVLEQLAGDLLEHATPEQVLATAFSRNHLITSEGGTLAAEFLNDYAADRVQTFGTAFLGLSLNCCRCHDHKFDPLTQEDFYSLQAYFNSIGEKHAENDASPAYVPWIEIASPLRPGGEKVRVMVMQEAAERTPTFVLTRGQYDQPNPERPVERRAPKALTHEQYQAGSDRLGLARWLIAEQNPLLARVTVNRIWQRFFGKGLVNTLDDLGAQGEYPSHPELLDYLAVMFRQGNANQGYPRWSVKHLIRLIVTSQTYQQAARVRPELLAFDPENRWLGYFPRQRLSGEELRDQALFAAGLLSPKIGGPPVFPYQPAGLWEERANEGSNTKVYQRSEGEALYRRSLYTFWKRTCPPPLMSVFDAPDRTACAVRRNATNTPLQALAVLNDEQFLECAKILAVRTVSEANEDPQRIQQMFQRLTGRTPTAVEQQRLLALLNQLRDRFRAAPDDALSLLRQGSTPAPTEHDAADLAAWMLVANACLNLDETLVRD